MKQQKVTLSDQCSDIGWSLTEVLAQKHDKRLWSLDGGPAGLPEEVVGQMLVGSGGSVSYCEGGAALLLMKAAALETLSAMNTFGDRIDAVTRYLEAQMTILADHTAEIVETVRCISPDALARNVNELATNSTLGSFFPRVKEAFMLELFEHLGRDKLADILLAFSAAPYDYRAGWPDLIVIKDGTMKLIEVKTSDKLLDSQLRFARGIGTPMGFDCGVVRLKAAKA
ncbi:VRR-NUC domain-containing protein [Pseudomonas caspiana]|nr:VRR-NUC domain-containing protein [Pseudomonas caspiana]TPG89830.1 VRR-NUC domain-containing protein [Pseudomonas caspiana]